MDLNTSVRDAILAELKRRSEAEEPAAAVDLSEPGYARIEGRIGIEALIMGAAGALAGGP